MAKGKKKITKVTKPKKKWFTALAPEIFKGLELGELPAFEAKNLQGRHISFSYNVVTGSPRDSHKKAVVEVDEVKGEKAYTKMKKFFLLDSFVQRGSKRFHGNNILVLKTKSKDNKTVKIKYSVLTRKGTVRAVTTQVFKAIEDQTKDLIGKKPADSVFAPGYLEKMSADIRKVIKPIYPIDRLQVWKCSILD
jgi:ribosomal protein S3AE